MLRSKSLRLIVVGGSAALIFFVLTYLFLAAGFPPFGSSIVAYGTAFVFAYIAQHSWTFGGKFDHGHALPRYIAAQIFCALLSGLVSHIAATAGAPTSIISASAAFAGSFASFLLVRFWVFTEADRNL